MDAASATYGTNSESTFFTLPAEIRNSIYRYALHREYKVLVQASRRHRLPDLVRASKQLRAECRQIFCEENSFFVRVKHARLPPPDHWIWHLGDRKQAEFYITGRPLKGEFFQWVRRYWQDGSMVQYSELENDKEVSITEETIYAAAFDLVDQIRHANASWEVVRGMLDTALYALRCVATDALWMHPEDLDSFARFTAMFEPTNWEGLEQAYETGNLEAWELDC